MKLKKMGSVLATAIIAGVGLTASTDRYRVTFKPSSLIRDVDLR